MKIGVITSAYPEFEDDPHGIFVHRLMKEISKHGHEVYVLAPYTGHKSEYILDDIKVKRFNYFYPKRFQKLCGKSGMIDNVKEGFFVKFQIFTFLFFNIFHSLREFKNMDIIHVQWPIPNGLGSLILKKIYGIPYINTIHGEEVYLSKRYHIIFAIKFLVKNSLKTVVNSSATLKSAAGVGIPKEKLKLIPFGVDTNFFLPMDMNKNKERFKILAVGYLIERKGFEYLIQAVKYVSKEYRNVELTIIGSGPLENHLNNVIKDLKLEKSSKIIKNVSDNELLKLYNSADIFVLPSIVDRQGNTEGLGVVLLEAMACKLPVIGSNIGGIPDIIKDHKTGLLVPEKDSFKLAGSIIRLIKDENLRNRLSENGYEQVKQKFSWEKIADDYIKTYEL
ncbi:MAG TPA: glycosyltransferase family 4 protein [Methanobacterium sp.]|nr:glycosyltransferase family 4 protein [Methanobacterium sp.]